MKKINCKKQHINEISNNKKCRFNLLKRLKIAELKEEGIPTKLLVLL